MESERPVEAMCPGLQASTRGRATVVARDAARSWSRSLVDLVGEPMRWTSASLLLHVAVGYHLSTPQDVRAPQHACTPQHVRTPQRRHAPPRAGQPDPDGNESDSAPPKRGLAAYLFEETKAVMASDFAFVAKVTKPAREALEARLTEVIEQARDALDEAQGTPPTSEQQLEAAEKVSALRAEINSLREAPADRTRNGARKQVAAALVQLTLAAPVELRPQLAAALDEAEAAQAEARAAQALDKALMAQVAAKVDAAVPLGQQEPEVSGAEAAVQAPASILFRLPADVSPGMVLSATLPDGTPIRFEAPDDAEPGQLVDLAEFTDEDGDKDDEEDDEEGDGALRGMVTPTSQSAAPSPVDGGATWPTTGP